MSKYRLLTTDMDGTLLDQRKQIPSTTISVFKQAHNQGKVICLSTGRALAELEDYPELLACIDYGILESGALLYDFKAHRALDKTIIPVECLKPIVEVAIDQDAMIQCLCEEGAFMTRKYLDHIEDFQMAVYRPMYERCATILDDVIPWIEEHASFEKINFFHKDPESRDISYESLKHLPVTLVTAEITSLEISPQNISKGQGLKTLCQHLSIPVDMTIAVGDANNDLDIMSVAGLSVALGNANEQVKKIADVIVNDNDHEGVRQAVEQFLIK